MKQINFSFKTKWLLVPLMLLILSVGNAWGTDEITYTLTAAATGGNTSPHNSYADAADYDCTYGTTTIRWNVIGNSYMVPWRIGKAKGNGTVTENFSLYSKTALSDNITKVVISHGTATATVNSIKLHVYSTAALAEAGGDGDVSANVTSSDSYADNGTMTFNRPSGHNWAGRYFRIVYNLTCETGTKKSGNAKYVAFSSASFYKAGCTALGQINGSVSLSQLTTPNPTKLKATWTMNATTGIASYDLEVYNSSNVKVKTINNYTSGSEITGLAPCTTYYVKLYTVSSGGSYCDGGLISTSSTCTTNSYSVNYDDCSGVTHSGATTVCASSDFSVTFNTASAAYVLPDNISVTIGGNTATVGTDYTWTKATGVLTIAAAKQTGNIVIDVDGVLVGCSADPTVTNEVLGLNSSGTFSLSQVDVSTSGWSTGSNTCEWSDYGFVWGTSANPTVANNKVPVGNSGSATSWNGSLTGDFSTGVTYHYRAYAKNSKTGAEYLYSSTEGTFTPYTVSYNKNDNSATGEVATVVVNAGGSVTLPDASAYELACNDLTKWALNSAGGTQYDPEDTYSSINANAVFYAIWNTRTYTVQYAAGTTPTNGGAITGSHANDTKTCGVNLTLPDTTFYSTGYKQDGWAKADGGNKTNNLKGSYSSNQAQIFYPHWAINTYNVTKGTATGCSGNDFTLSTSTVNHYGSITVTATADATHKGSAQVSVSPEGNASVSGTTISNITGNITVSVSFAAKETATVILHDATGAHTQDGTRYEADNYTLPSTAAECTESELYGWYIETYVDQPTAPSGAKYIAKNASKTLAAGDNHFYAVYATVEDRYTNNYTKITSVNDLETGDYLISSGTYCMNNTITSNRMAEISLSANNNVKSNPAASLIWTITKSGTKVTLYNDNVSKYLAVSGGVIAVQDNAHNFTFDYGTTKENSWTFTSETSPTYQLSYSTISGNSYNYFVMNTSQTAQIDLYKRDKAPSAGAPYTTSPNCTTHDLASAIDPSSPVSGTVELGKTTVLVGKTTTAEATASDHYTFSYWTISGTGATMSNTSEGKSTDNPVTVTMGTADATITAHFTEKPKCTVKFYNNGGSALSSTTYWLGENPTAPTLKDGTTGDGNACDATSDTHYGWTQTTWEETLSQSQVDAKTAADVKVYAKDATLPAITAGDDGKTIEYHAVWAHEANSSVSKNYTLSISYSDCPSSYSNSLPTKNAEEVGGTGTVSVSFGGTGVMNQDSKIQFRRSKNGAGYIYNTVDLENITGITTNNDDIAYNIGTSENPSSGTSGGYFKIYNNSDNTVNPSGITVNFTKTVGSITYSAFLTNCCNQLDQINGAVTIDGINEGAATAHWVLADHTGISKYTLNVYKADNSFVKSVDVTNPTLRKADIGGLETCTEYYVTITTVAADGYCAGSEQGKSANFTTNGWAVHYTSENDETALLSNVTKLTGEDYMCLGEDNYVATFQASVGYKLPSTITVWYIDDVMDEGYTWNSATGTLTIPTAGVSEEFNVRIIGECITPNITADPVGAVYALNEEATPLSVTVEGAGTWCGYQWQSKVGEGDWTDIQNATNSSYTPSTASAGTTTLYRVKVTNIASGCSAFAYSEAATVEVSALPVCAQPTFSIAAGTKLGAQSVTLGCETANATIYYTTNGSDPEEIEANRYNGSAIAISQNTTIKAIAAKSGMTTSAVASATYTIKCKAPTFTVDAGTYNDTKSVELASDYGTVYYTVDGSDPATDGVEYSEAIPVTLSTTIRAIAKMANCENSDEASAVYTLKCATPSFSVAAGEQIGAQNVTLTSTAGASIYYTTNEATPTTSSTLYESAIPVSSAMTIKAIAVKDGWSNSDVATAAYTIKYTLTFQNNGVTLAEGGTKNLAPGEAYGTLPTLTSGNCDQTSTTFMGWSTAVITDKQADAPAYASAETTMGEGHVTLNAVWAKQTGTPTASGFVNTVSAGDYVAIVEVDHGTKELTSLHANNYGIGTNYTATPAGTWIFEVVSGASNGTVAFKYMDGNTPKYLSYSSTTNTLDTETEVNAKCSWTVTESSSRAEVVNANSATRKLMWNEANTRFACYANKSHGDGNTNQHFYYPRFYGIPQVTYTDYITTCCDEWTATAKYGTNNIINVDDVVAVTVTGTAYGTATYESNKTDVLTVAANGAITGKKAGSATVTIAWAGIPGSKCAFETTVDVTVNGPITVTYNKNDGSETPATTSQNATSNTKFTLNANSFGRTGYTFQGWATTPSGDVAYTDKEADVEFAENTVLYAVWAINSHAITLTQPTGNTITANSSTTPGSVTYGTTVNLTATENDGYVFTGWSVDGATVVDANAKSTSFTMPDNAVSVTASYSTYTWVEASPFYSVTTAPKTTYNKLEKFSTAGVVIKENYKRSDNNEITKQETYSGAWTAKLDGVAIVNGADLSLADNGKTLILYISSTEIASYTLTVEDIDADQFIDGLWGETFTLMTGTYDMPTPQAHDAGATDCLKHNTFAGWVLAAKADNPTVDDLVTTTTDVTAANNTYYAVWSKSENVNKDFTVSKNSFASGENGLDASVNIGTDISYRTQKNGGTSNPAVVSGPVLRLYKLGSNQSYGGSITISAVSGASLKKVEMTVSYATYKYIKNTYTTTGLQDGTITDGKIVLDNISSNNLTIVNVGSTQLDISKIEVTYTKTVTEIDYITDCDPRYDVQFNVGTSVTGSYDKVTKKAGVEITLPDGSALSKDHHTFAGWYSAHYDATYSATNEWKYIVPAGGETLVAQWTEDHHAFVTFKNGENTIGEPLKVYDGGVFNLLGAQEADGKAFIGWKWNGNKYKAAQASQHMDDPAVDRTYTAVWMPVIDVATIASTDLSDGKWILVEHKSQLKAGDFIVIAAAGYDVAISNYQKTSNRDEAAVSKNVDTLSYTSNVAPLFLQYDPENDYYAFYDRAYSTTSGGATNNSGYLYSDNNLKTQAEINGFQGVWSINITDKKASIVAQGNNDERIMRYNASSTGKLFSVYESTTQKDIAIYKWAKNISSDMNVSDVTNTDMVIVNNGSTLTIDEPTTLDNLIVEAGGKVSGSEALTVNDLTIKTSLGTISGTDSNTSGKSGEISNSNINASGDVWIEIELTQESEASYGWYAFSVPFKVDAMHGVYGKPDDGDWQELQNEVGYAIMKYHGDVRAQGLYGWKKYRDIMKPGTLYIIAVGKTEYKTLRFKKVADAAIVNENQVQVYQYPLQEGGQTGDQGWNGIGNPNLQVSHLNGDLQFLDHEANRFILRDGNETKLLVGTAFMMQRGADETITINTGAGSGSIALAPAREPRGVETQTFKVYLTDEATGKGEDNLFLRTSEDATNNYEVGHDLAKMSMGDAKCAQMWVPAYGTQLCAAYFPLISDKAEYPLSINTPKAGTYSISVQENEHATIYLTYNGRAIWNLSMSACELDLTKGLNEGYGLRLVVNAPAVVTGVDQIDAKAGAQKVIIDEHVYILRGGQIYGIDGKIVK